jgi:NADH:ubiquinone oxidoreductase subunit C
MINYLDPKPLWKTKLNALILINILLNVLKQLRIVNNEFDIKSTQKHVITIFKFFKNASMLKLLQLIDIVGIELSGKIIKYNVIYLMLSIVYQIRISLSVQITNLAKLQSISNLFENATWLECEVWDLFGIFFNKNDNLRRILTDYGFIHHPFKKNFPLTGYYELNYSFVNKLIELKKTILVQELRNLLSENNWNFTFQIQLSEDSDLVDDKNILALEEIIRRFLLSFVFKINGLFDLPIFHKIWWNLTYYRILTLNFNFFLIIIYIDKQFDLIANERFSLN